jgi:PHD/YefM family antitoxin component YafN of YafNO toxin-antitoxin module
MKYMTVSGARKNIAQLAESPEGTVITRSGQPAAVVLPIREYLAMRAMLKLSARPELLERVVTAHERVQRGELEDFVEGQSEHDAPAVRKSSI